MTSGQFVFNGSRTDLEQVSEFLPDYLAVAERLDADAGLDAFRGLLPAIAGSQEAIALYLLQQLRLKRARQALVQQLLAAGYRHIAYVPFGGARFEHVIVYGDYGDHDDGSHAWDEFHNARLIPQTNLRVAKHDGPIAGVIPFQRRTITRRIVGERVLAKPFPDRP